MARYSYQHVQTADGRQITICHSRYAGKHIIGKAICRPEDSYDPEVGERIAKAKLDSKVQNIIIKKHKNSIAFYESDLKYVKDALAKELYRLGRDERMLEECEEILKQYK